MGGTMRGAMREFHGAMPTCNLISEPSKVKLVR